MPDIYERALEIAPRVVRDMGSIHLSIHPKNSMPSIDIGSWVWHASGRVERKKMKKFLSSIGRGNTEVRGAVLIGGMIHGQKDLSPTEVEKLPGSVRGFSLKTLASIFIDDAKQYEKKMSLN